MCYRKWSHSAEFEFKVRTRHSRNGPPVGRLETFSSSRFFTRRTQLSFGTMKRQDSSDSNPSQISSSAPSARGPLSSSAILGHFNAITSSIQRRLSGGLSSSPRSSTSHEDESQQHYDLHESDPPLAPITLKGFSATTTERILTEKLAEDIRLMMPARLQVQEDWELVYSLDQHGVSLATLYARSRAYNSPQAGYVVIVKDRQENIFGAYLSDFPHVHPHYYGTGECFLFKFTLWQHVHNKYAPAVPSSSAAPSEGGLQLTSHLTIHKLVPPSSHHSHSPTESQPAESTRPSSRGSTDTTSSQYQFKGFSYTGLNDYMILCTPQFLSVGGGLTPLFETLLMSGMGNMGYL